MAEVTCPRHGHALQLLEEGTLNGVHVRYFGGCPGTRTKVVRCEFHDGLTLEVTRVAVDGTRNANSMLYAAAWRASKARGYQRLVTYTETGESGASLRAAGWRIVAELPARKGWSTPSRPRDDRAYRSLPRTLWEAS